MQFAVEALFSKWNLQNVTIVNDEAWCNCPFHGEKNPSFSVNIATGKFNCFSCHAHGTSIKQLIARMEGIPEKYADDILENYGVNTLAMLKEELRTLFHLKIASRLENISAVDLTATNNWKLYADNPCKYLRGRGFSRNVLRRHRIGYDTMRRTAVFPVFEGDVCRFTYNRITWKTNKGKNPYEYPSGIDKSMYLYGVDRPVEYFYDQPLFVSEGALETLWLRQHGFERSVSILGSYLSRVQLKKIELLNPSEIILCGDNDQAGYDMTVSAGRMFLSAGFRRVSYLPFPKGINDLPETDAKQLTRMVARRKSVRKFVLAPEKASRLNYLLAV